MPTSVIEMTLQWTCECKARSWNHHEVCDACGTPKPAPVEEPPSDAAPPELDAALSIPTFREVFQRDLERAYPGAVLPDVDALHAALTDYHMAATTQQRREAHDRAM